MGVFLFKGKMSPVCARLDFVNKKCYNKYGIRNGDRNEKGIFRIFGQPNGSCAK